MSFAITSSATGRDFLRDPALMDVETIIFVLNREDFQRPSRWSNEFDHRLEQPASHLVFAVRKLLRNPASEDRSLPVRQSDLAADWARFAQSTSAKIFVVGYDAPDTQGQSCDWLPEWLHVGSRMACFDALTHGGEAILLDGFHPGAKGNQALARFIAVRVASVREGPAPSAAVR